jgi:hypothetical protein
VLERAIGKEPQRGMLRLGELAAWKIHRSERDNTQGSSS